MSRFNPKLPAALVSGVICLALGVAAFLPSVRLNATLRVEFKR